jgi:coenzyme Q-binding protein COQ10
VAHDPEKWESVFGPDHAQASPNALMPQFTTKRRVRHSASDMFDLVADVERYPEFVPLCKALKVRQRGPAGEGVETVVADMTVSFKLVRESFRSRVTLNRPELQILVEYLQGPFSQMQNRWTFRPDGEQACEINFFINYEFRSRTLGMLMGGMFDLAFRRFAAAFEARADKVYGRKTA